MKPARIAIACLCFALLIPSAARAEETARWKLQQGQVLRYRHVHISDRREQEGVLSYPVDRSKTTADIVWNVENVESDGTAHVRQVFETCMIEKVLQGRDASTKRHHLHGGMFSFRLSPQGEASHIVLTPEMIAKRDKANEKDNFSDAYLKIMMPLLLLPKRTTYPEDGWSELRRFEDGQAAEDGAIATYRFIGSERREGHEVHLFQSMTKYDYRNIKPLQGFFSSKTPTGTWKGACKFDVTEGRLLEFKDTYRIDTPISKPGGGSVLRADWSLEWKFLAGA